MAGAGHRWLSAGGGALWRPGLGNTSRWAASPARGSWKAVGAGACSSSALVTLPDSSHSPLTSPGDRCPAQVQMRTQVGEVPSLQDHDQDGLAVQVLVRILQASGSLLPHTGSLASHILPLGAPAHP